jgi:signal transduction histidine kinase
MLLLVAVLSWLLQVTSTQASSINKSLATIAQSETVLTLMIDYGDSWRNYKATGDTVFLQQFTKDRLQVPSALESLRALARTNPAAARREGQIESDFRDWMRVQTSAPPALLNLRSGSWQLLINLKLNQVRGDVGALIIEERDILSNQVERQRGSALFLFLALGGGAFSVAGLLSYQSWRAVKTLSDRYEEALTQIIEKSSELQRSNSELDKRVEERTKELNVVNKELEVFCYSAAHDLRSPLRWINSASLIFIEDYGHLVPEAGLAELKKVSSAATRLSKLIDSLLEMARLGKVDLNEVEVDLSETCKRVVLEIRSRDWAGPVAVSIQPDILVAGDPLLLSLLVQNLIENAFKFCSPTGEGKIEIHARQEIAEIVVTVHDNGVGFDESYVDKLFKPFERLHSSTEFSGTGMGLANAKRIVDRHGGRIWAESKPGEGATFRFALQQAESSGGSAH